MFNKLSIAGSLIGGMVETQECIDFCAKHNIVPSIKKVTVKDIEGVYKQLSAKNDAIIRNVLDIEASKWGISSALKPASEESYQQKNRNDKIEMLPTRSSMHFQKVEILPWEMLMNLKCTFLKFLSFNFLHLKNDTFFIDNSIELCVYSIGNQDKCQDSITKKMQCNSYFVVCQRMNFVVQIKQVVKIK